MNRFLFRAWNGGKMIYFGNGFVGFMPTDDDTTKAGLFFPIENEKFSMSEFDLMQCAGIPAKKSYRGETERDKLIFEGDIVRRGNTRYAVIWFHNAWVLKSEKGVAWDLTRLNELEIIGNIHDNPELLEVSNGD
jgi:hypothetical protein